MSFSLPTRAECKAINDHHYDTLIDRVERYIQKEREEAEQRFEQKTRAVVSAVRSKLGDQSEKYREKIALHYDKCIQSGKYPEMRLHVNHIFQFACLQADMDRAKNAVLDSLCKSDICKASEIGQIYPVFKIHTANGEQEYECIDFVFRPFSPEAAKRVLLRIQEYEKNYNSYLQSIKTACVPASL